MKSYDCIFRCSETDPEQPPAVCCEATVLALQRRQQSSGYKQAQLPVSFPAAEL